VLAYHPPKLAAATLQPALDGAVRALAEAPTASSLGVVASAILVALGAQIGDPLIGLAITLVILKITWDSWRVVSTTDPGEMESTRRPRIILGTGSPQRLPTLGITDLAGRTEVARPRKARRNAATPDTREPASLSGNPHGSTPSSRSW
jgi:hypothetical protein